VPVPAEPCSPSPPPFTTPPPLLAPPTLFASRKKGPSSKSGSVIFIPDSKGMVLQRAYPVAAAQHCLSRLVCCGAQCRTVRPLLMSAQAASSTLTV
jgi:hypothetical protein